MSCACRTLRGHISTENKKKRKHEQYFQLKTEKKCEKFFPREISFFEAVIESKNADVLSCSFLLSLETKGKKEEIQDAELRAGTSAFIWQHERMWHDFLRRETGILTCCVIACWVRLKANSKSWTVYAWWCGPPATSWGFDWACTRRFFIMRENVKMLPPLAFRPLLPLMDLSKKLAWKNII